MQTRAQQSRPYFYVGNKVQLGPSSSLLRGKNLLTGAHATITRIQQVPDPNFIDFETQEEWDIFRRTRSVLFWVKVDAFSEMHEYYQQNEVSFYYWELQPIPSKMNKSQQAQHCKDRFLKEPDEHRAKIYLEITRYLLNGERLVWPLSSIDMPAPRGYAIDLINSFINGATQIRELVQEGLEREQAGSIVSYHENLAQMCDEIAQLLQPKPRALV